LKRIPWLVCGFLWLAFDASAQLRTWSDRGFANLNGGSQTGSQDLSASWTFSRFGEEGRVDVQHGIDRSGGVFDVSGGARIWWNLGFGVGYSRVSGTTDATVQGSVPHPLFVRRPRSATVSVSELTRTEQAVHFQVVWLTPIVRQLDVAVSVGPSVVTLEQALVTNADASEVGPPFSQVNIATTTTEQTKRTAGLNLGVDVNYMVTRTWGAGLLLRYLRASIDLPFRADAVSLDMGGFHVAGGVRVRF